MGPEALRAPPDGQSQTEARIMLSLTRATRGECDGHRHRMATLGLGRSRRRPQVAGAVVRDLTATPPACESDVRRT